VLSNTTKMNLIRQVKKKKQGGREQHSIRCTGATTIGSSQDAADMSKHELGTAVQKLHIDPPLVHRKQAHHDTEAPKLLHCRAS